VPAKKIFKPAKQPKRAVRSTAETTKKVARKGEVSQSFLWRQTFKKLMRTSLYTLAWRFPFLRIF